MESPAATDPPFLAWIGQDATEMLALTAGQELDTAVPTCPGWSLTDLVGHLFGAHLWVAHCVASGTTAQQRDLPAAPTERRELTEWAQQALDTVLSSLASTPPEELVWTPLRGPAPSVWWRRKAAVEGAIHRWDAQNALPMPASPIQPRLALAGIDEFTQEFLPLMLQAVTEPAPVSTIRLQPTDVAERRVVTLRTPTGQQPREPEVVISGTASDLLLWIWNRISLQRLDIDGDTSVAQWWKALAI